MSKNTEHICFFNSHVEWGGGEKWHAEAALSMSKKGHPVILVAHRHGKLIRRTRYDMKVKPILLTNLSFFNILRYIQLYILFKRYAVKTIVMCLPIDVKVAGVAAKLAGVKNIIYRRGSAIPIKNSGYNRFLFSKIVTHVIANSEATADTILEKNQQLFPREKITVLYNGIELPELVEKQNNEKIIIAAAGRLEYQKNFTVLIDVAEILIKHGHTFEIQIAGEGSEQKALHDKIVQFGVEDYVKLIGFQVDLPKFLRTADVFVLPSHWEGFGFVLAEAMAQELPIVAFNVSSNPELVVDEETGFLVPWGNIAEFAEKIEMLIKSEKLRLAMGANGWERVNDHFSVDVVHNKLETYLLGLHSK